MSLTSATAAGLRLYDHLKPDDAVVRAWSRPGPNARLHYEMQDQLRRTMPLLARALDRLAYGNYILGRLDESRSNSGNTRSASGVRS